MTASLQYFSDLGIARVTWCVVEHADNPTTAECSLRSCYTTALANTHGTVMGFKTLLGQQINHHSSSVLLEWNETFKMLI